MKKQAGFTLIELIMVIVILGILSAFALPRFADLSGNAEEAALQGAYASAKSTSAIMHASALANAETGTTGNITMEGENFATVFGYPDAGGANDDDGTVPSGSPLVSNGFGISEAANLTDYALVYGSTAATPVYNSTTTSPETDATSVVVTSRPVALGNPCFIYTEAGAAGDAPTFTDVGVLGGSLAALTC